VCTDDPCWTVLRSILPARRRCHTRNTRNTRNRPAIHIRTRERAGIQPPGAFFVSVDAAATSARVGGALARRLTRQMLMAYDTREAALHAQAPGNGSTASF
jgi:hypothetical protein